MQVDTEERARVDPRTVLSIILGGGAGTRLYPLTKGRAKPAVSSSTLSLLNYYSKSVYDRADCRRLLQRDGCIVTHHL